MSVETDHEADESGEDEPERSPAPVEVVSPPGVLQGLLEPLLALADEARIHFDPDAVRVRLIDPADVAAAHIELDAEAFVAYEASGTTVGFNLSKLDEVVGHSTGDVSLSFDPQTYRLTVSFDGSEFRAGTLDQETIRHEPDKPDLDLPASFRTEGRHLDRVQKLVEVVLSDYDEGVTIEARPDEEVVAFTAEGDVDRMDVTLGSEELSQAKLPDRVSSALSHSYLESLVKPIGKEALVDIELGDDFPVVWEYDFAEGYGRVWNGIAPRIETGR